MNFIPATPEEIDAAWLSEALSSRHPGARVRDVELTERHEVTNTHAKLRVSYEESAGAPSQLFCKLLPTPTDDPVRRQAIARTGMGPREALFYDKLAPRLELRVPRVYVARHDATQGDFILLMEDLDASGCTVSNGPASVTPDAAAKALEDLAGLHIRFEDPKRRRAEAPWVSPPDPPSDYGSTRLQFALDHHRDRLSPSFVELSELYIEKQSALHELWISGPETLIHGDTHVGNLFFDDGRTGFLDWGLVQLNTPLRDVSYFLNMTLSPAERGRHEARLLHHYLDIRNASKVTPIDFDSAWRAHRLHAAYLVPACCQIVTFPDGISERRRVFAEAFLARAEAAIEELEVRDALKGYAGL